MRLLSHKRKEKKRIFQTTLEIIILDITVRIFGTKTFSDAIYEMCFNSAVAYYFASRCG